MCYLTGVIKGLLRSQVHGNSFFILYSCRNKTILRQNILKELLLPYKFFLRIVAMEVNLKITSDWKNKYIKKGYIKSIRGKYAKKYNCMHIFVAINLLVFL